MFVIGVENVLGVDTHGSRSVAESTNLDIFVVHVVLPSPYDLCCVLEMLSKHVSKKTVADVWSGGLP